MVEVEYIKPINRDYLHNIFCEVDKCIVRDIGPKRKTLPKNFITSSRYDSQLQEVYIGGSGESEEVYPNRIIVRLVDKLVDVRGDGNPKGPLVNLAVALAKSCQMIPSEDKHDYRVRVF